MWTTSCEPIFTQFQRKWTDLWPIEIKLTVSHSIDKWTYLKQNQHFQKTACFTVITWKTIYFPKMNRFKENQQFSVVLSSGHQNEHFQDIACSHLVSLLRKLWIFTIWTHFSEITDSNRFSKESLLPFAVSSQKIVYFHEMNRFPWKSVFSRDNLLDINQISKELYRSVSFIEKSCILRKLTDFYKISIFQWN